MRSGGRFQVAVLANTTADVKLELRDGRVHLVDLDLSRPLVVRNGTRLLDALAGVANVRVPGFISRTLMSTVVGDVTIDHLQLQYDRASTGLKSVIWGSAKLGGIPFPLLGAAFPARLRSPKVDAVAAVFRELQQMLGSELGKLVEIATGDLGLKTRAEIPGEAPVDASLTGPFSVDLGSSRARIALSEGTTLRIDAPGLRGHFAITGELDIEAPAPMAPPPTER